MRIVSRLLFIALLTAGLWACGKQSPIGGGDATVLATVNGTPITSEMVRQFALERTGREPENDEERRGVLNLLIDMEVLAQEAQRSGAAEKPDVIAQLALNRAQTLAGRQVESYMQQHPVTPEQLKSAYDNNVKKMGGYQYKARHILVPTEDQAKDIITQLNKGADFAQLATKYSKDLGTAARGGDLGDWFSLGDMDPGFSAAVSTLKKGEYTKQPAHSRFGWHVIQLEDIQKVTPPSMDLVRDQIMKQAEGDQMEGYINQLRAAARIKMTDGSSANPAAVTAPAPATAAKP
ncbi:MAG TPA: peptidylprolyl isomerase [Gammaproteobacteria bacterium]|nr:peptidylprolyl isomerase [Gammaproteobacteria bacterium]